MIRREELELQIAHNSQKHESEPISQQLKLLSQEPKISTLVMVIYNKVNKELIT